MTDIVKKTSVGVLCLLLVTALCTLLVLLSHTLGWYLIILIFAILVVLVLGYGIGALLIGDK
jgi:hypothetical protein